MNQNGNALFLILIAVALFAALSYAVTQSGRGGGSVDREQAQINSAVMTQYAVALESTIQRMRLLSGCSDIQISFWNDSDGNGTENGSDDYFNPNAPTDRSCHVFDSNGGDFQPQDFTSLGLHVLYSGENAVENLGACGDNSAPACRELMFLIAGISDAACAAINLEFTGDSTVAADEIASNYTAVNRFNGVYGNVASSYVDGTQHEGIATGCVIDDNGPTFYHVLIER